MKQKNKVLGFQPSIVGFLIALALIGMLALTFGTFATEMQTEYNVTGNITIADYEEFESLKNHTRDIRNSSMEMSTDTGILDVIGGFFRSGYTALKTIISSFGLFENLISTAAGDNVVVSFFQDYLAFIVIIIIFLGILIAAVLKWRI